MTRRMDDADLAFPDVKNLVVFQMKVGPDTEGFFISSMDTDWSPCGAFHLFQGHDMVHVAVGLKNESHTSSPDSLKNPVSLGSRVDDGTLFGVRIDKGINIVLKGTQCHLPQKNALKVDLFHKLLQVRLGLLKEVVLLKARHRCFA